MLLWIALGAAALTDWFAVYLNRQTIEEKAKPAVMIVLIVIAAALPFDPGSAKVAIMVGLIAGLVGDVLLLDRVDNFIGGLVAFFVGHVAYVVGLLQVGVGGWAWLAASIGLTIALAVTARLPALLRAVKRDHSELLVPVVAYSVVILVMMATAIATSRLLLAAGALLFVASDRLLAEDRFVAPRPELRWLVHVLYHLGQIGIVIGMAG